MEPTHLLRNLRLALMFGVPVCAKAETSVHGVCVCSAQYSSRLPKRLVDPRHECPSELARGGGSAQALDTSRSSEFRGERLSIVADSCLVVVMYVENFFLADSAIASDVDVDADVPCARD